MVMRSEIVDRKFNAPPFAGLFVAIRVHSWLPSRPLRPIAIFCETVPESDRNSVLSKTISACTSAHLRAPARTDVQRLQATEKVCDVIASAQTSERTETMNSKSPNQKCAKVRRDVKLPSPLGRGTKGEGQTSYSLRRGPLQVGRDVPIAPRIRRGELREPNQSKIPNPKSKMRCTLPASLPHLYQLWVQALPARTQNHHTLTTIFKFSAQP